MHVIFKKCLTLITLLLFTALSFVPIVDSSNIIINGIEISAADNHESSILNIDASSSYDYGYKAGKQLKSEYGLINILSSFVKNNDYDEKDIENQIEIIENYYPSFFEELRGLSYSTHIQIKRLVYLQNFLYYALGGSCTTTISTGFATKNNETFLTDNVDIDCDRSEGAFHYIKKIITSRLTNSKLWLAEDRTLMGDHENCYKYIFRGIPVLYEVPIINEKGLGLGGTSTKATENKSRYIDEGSGFPISMLIKLAMMTCKNVSEVADLYKRNERFSELYGKQINPVTSWCDREGGILIIEESHNHIITVFRNNTDVTGASEDILWHANHHQWLNPDLTGSVYPEEYPSSALRAERARQLLEQNYGNITLDVCKAIIRDHDGGFDPDGKDSGDICRHSDKNKFDTTLIAYIIDPKNLTIYYAHGSPCKSIFWRYDFSKKFEK